MRSSHLAHDPGVLRLLLVEDDEEDYILTRDALASIPGTRYELEWASTFEKGMDLLVRGEHDACLLDYRLGARNGLDFLRTALDHDVQAPIIALTGSGDTEADRSLMEAGAADFLEKQRLDAHVLGRSIRYAIEHKRIERAQRSLAEAGRALAASLDHDTTMGVAARVAVPGLADWSWLLVTGAGPGRRAVEAFHVDEAGEEAIRRFVEIPLAPGDFPLVERVLEMGAAAVLPTLPAELPGDVIAGEVHRDLFRALGTRSLAAMPLRMRGRVLGVLVLGRPSTRRAFDSRDLSVAQELADTVALALENARVYEAAQEAVRVRNDLLSMVSHDLGNPLAAVVMVVERLLETIDDKESPRTRSHLEMIQGSAHTMVRMVQDLLSVGRAEAGHFTIEREPGSITTVVLRAVRQFDEAAHKAGVALDAELPKRPLSAELDEVRIMQVLANLLSNALKYTPRGGRIVVRVAEGEGEVTVSVRDSGPGIQTEDLPHLFDRFWQARRTRRGGAGLGLTIAREIVIGHGGRIWADSTPGRGSTFHFTLPLSSRGASGE